MMKRDRTEASSRTAPVTARVHRAPLGQSSVGNKPTTTKYASARTREKEEAEERAREKKRQDALRKEKEHWSRLLLELQEAEGEVRDEIDDLKSVQIPAFELQIDELLNKQDQELRTLETQLLEQRNQEEENIDALNRRRFDLSAEEKTHQQETIHQEEAVLLKHLEVDEAVKDKEKTTLRLQQVNGELNEVKHLGVEAKRQLDAKLAEEKLKKSDDYGVSEDVAKIVNSTKKALEMTKEIDQKSREIEIERRAKFNRYEELKGTIRVYCRVKGGEAENPARVSCQSISSTTSSVSSQQRTSCIEGENISITQSRANATSTGTKDFTKNFKFDRVYSPETEQQTVFDDVGNLIDSAVDGYRVCILAYGQTGSGKTYTMEGVSAPPASSSSFGGKKQASSSAFLPDGAGVIPRSINKIFSRAADLKQEGWTYTMKCSFLEIYNDTIRDLLETSDAYHRGFAAGSKETGIKDRHEIRHNGKVDTIVTNIHEKVVSCPEDVHKLLGVAVGNRSVAKTNMNERSSRSHCCFMMKIEGRNQSIGGGQVSTGNLCLVDLAGSERVSDSGVQGQQKKEAVAINQSLSALGDCIHALGQPGAVVSWRANKLTYLLQNYLGGEGAKMLMFVMISNNEEHVRESLNSLEFAEKVNNTHVGTAKRRVAGAGH